MDFALKDWFPGRQQGIEPVQEFLPILGGRGAVDVVDQTHHGKRLKARLHLLMVRWRGPSRGKIAVDWDLGQIYQ